MPRKRERITTKASWTVETLEYAVKKLRRGDTSVYKVSKETGIPYSTLKKRFRLAKSNNASYKDPPKLGRPPVFTEEQEAILADHLRTMSNKFYGLTRSQFCKICYAMAEKFGVADRFNEAKKSAGRDFVTGFFQRHPNLSIRKPEATSINRILGFNKVEVDRFFENLEIVMTKHHFPPSRIYNMDETGVTTVQETEKIIAPRGQKRVGSVTSWERGKNVTVICAMSASGSYIPPLFIFPRQRHSPQLEKDGPPGAAYTFSHNGWTNESIFIKWLRHFIEHSKPTSEQPILLIMDNHNSHCTLEAWEVAKANNVVMLSIPPHSSHRLQPLDVTFFGPLKRAYNKECDMFIKSRMVKITPYEIAGLFNKAYARVASLDKGISGFKATGIFPMNPAVFSEDDFIAVDKDHNPVNEQVSSAAQSQRPVSQQLATGNSDPLPSTSRGTGNSDPLPSTSRGTGNSEPLPSTSRVTNNSGTLPSTSRGIQQELEMDSFVLIGSTLNIEQEQSRAVMNPATNLSTSSDLKQDSLTVSSATMFLSTGNVSQEQLPDIDHAASPSILNDQQEEVSTSNCTAKLSPNINPATILFVLNDKTVLEPATAYPAMTSSTTNTTTQRQSNFLQAVTVDFDAQTSACPITKEKSDFAKVLSVVSPLPNISNKNKTSRQKQHSIILSSTPMKTVFEEKEKKRLEKKCRTKIDPKKKGDTSKIQEIKQKNIQKHTETSNKESKSTTERGKKRKKTTNKKEKVKRVKKKLFEDKTDTSEEESENLCDDESECSEGDTLCAICCDKGKNNEMWYRCRGCGKWAHEQCSGSDSPVDYICVFCLDL